MRPRIKPPHVFLILLLAAIGLFLLWDQEDSTPDLAAPEHLESMPAPAPASELAAVELETVSADNAENTPAVERLNSAPRENGKTWVVHGFCAEPLPTKVQQAEIRATLHAGHNADAPILEEAVLKANAEGKFSWALTPPEQTVYLYVRPKKTEELNGYGDGRRILLGHSPPQDLRVRFLTWDLPIHGSVLDIDGNPIPDASVTSLGRTIPINAEGLFSGIATSSNESVAVTARAPGFVPQQQRFPTAGLADKNIEFQLLRGMNLAGLVVDINHVPLQGVEVKTFTQNAEAVYSDEAGRFRLGALAADSGSVMVYARSADYAETSIRLETSGEDMTDLVLMMHSGAAVHGSVVLEDGTPVKDANVYLGFSPYAYNRVDTYTDARGVFEFAHVGEGSNTLVVEQAGFLPNKTEFEIPAGHASVEPLQVVLQQGIDLTGQVVDTAGNPMEKVWVSVAIGRSDTAQRPKTDAEGRFRLTGLPTANVTISLYMPGYVRLEHKMVAEDYQNSDLRLVMQSSSGISGTVVDAVTGKALDEFRIQLSHPTHLRADQTSVHSFSASWSAPGKTFHQAHGKWTAVGEGFQPGSWIGVSVFAEGYVSQSIDAVLIPADPAASPLAFALLKGAGIEGVVLPQAGGAPILGATVTALRKDDLEAWRDLKRKGFPQAKTDGVGHFQLDGLPSGDLWFRVEHKSWPSQTVGPISMPESGSPAPLTILLHAGASLYGKVRGRDGMVVPGAEVSVMRQAQGASPLLMKSTTTDLNGEYRFEHLADGTYDVSADRVPNLPDSISMTLRTLLQDGQDVNMDFDATGTASVSGAILWDGVLPKRLQVQLSLPSRWDDSAPALVPGAAISVGYSTQAVDGKFHFPNVAPGAYNLICIFTGPEDQGFHFAQLRIEVLPDGEHKADLTVQ